MEGVKFVDVLRSFEEQIKGDEYGRPKKEYDEKRVIENDVRRTMLLGIDKDNRRVIRVLKKILFETLNEIPIKYTQGMSEIASVFVVYYFRGIVDKEVSKDTSEAEAHEVLEEHSSSDQAANSSSEQFITVPDAERAEFEKFISKHESQTRKLKTVVTNVFRRKFEPLVADDFKLYKENMSVFVEMMKKRGVRIPELESHRFMGSILTFFLRNLTRTEDVYKVFEIILSCPNTCPFLLLTVFHDKVSSNRAIGKVKDDLFPKIAKLEEEFVETKKGMERENTGVSMRSVLIAGGVASVIAAILVYRATKKE